MFKVKLNTNVEFTVKCSTRVALIARLVGECSEGFYFIDELANERFAVRKADITSIRSL